jgi:hypothetical protein
MERINKGISRRDFLKTTGAFIMISQFPKLDRVLGGGLPEGASGVDFDIDQAPNKAFISFAVDSMLVVNSANNLQGQRFESAVAQGLSQKGYDSIAKESGALQAIHILGSGNVQGWSQLLAAAGSEMYGAPVMPGAGKVIDFGILFPWIDQLAPGDILTAGSEVAVIAKANDLVTGAPMVLGTYIKNGLKSGITAEWMNQDRLFAVAGGALALRKVVRGAEMDILILENANRISSFDAGIAKQVDRGVLDNIEPNTVSEVFAAMIAKGSTLPKTESGKSVWVTDGLKKLQYVTDANAQIWLKNRTVYKGEAFGLADTMLIQDIFPLAKYEDPDAYDQGFLLTDICHKGLDLFAFVTNVQAGNLSIHDLVANPQKAPITGGLAWTIPAGMNDFAFGDSVFVAPRDGLTKPEVGFVGSAEIGPDSQSVNLIFLDRKSVV